MQILEINGGHKLSGTISIGGAKNDIVSLLPAAILSDDQIELSNIPQIEDVNAIFSIFTFLGVKYYREQDKIIINSNLMSNKKIPENISSKLRASYYFMGVLLSKYRHVELYMPGGCKIGLRPIDLHLKGFEALGAKVKYNDHKITISADKLIGNEIYLDVASVGATINIMFAAVKAEGTTVIDNAAKEPEIVNVANLLIKMGAKITGAGTETIVIEGVSYLSSAKHEVIPDRIEAGTYLILGALIGENLIIKDIIPEHLTALILKLQQIGADLTITEDSIKITANSYYKSCDINTAVYPGFPTDLQQPFLTLLTQCHGRAKVEEKIYESRFQNVSYLNEMGAKILVKQNIALVEGPTKLFGERVVATDLRAGACLVLAALIAKGTTTIIDIEHILRGYEKIVEKLSNVGADIKIIKE